MFLLDTNVVSELRRPERADRGVRRWADGADAGLLYLSVITIWEIEEGVLRVERRDQRAGITLRRWLEEVVLPAYAGRILTVDLPVARNCATLRVPDRRPERDALIAATARVHGLTIVTRNVRDFVPMGVPVFNPWDAAA